MLDFSSLDGDDLNKSFFAFLSVRLTGRLDFTFFKSRGDFCGSSALSVILAPTTLGEVTYLVLLWNELKLSLTCLDYLLEGSGAGVERDIISLIFLSISSLYFYFNSLTLISTLSDTFCFSVALN